tara:strand:- start:63394 stop:65193 length:1800 start_codon:yes stop_codon:yes gene_type:complete
VPKLTSRQTMLAAFLLLGLISAIIGTFGYFGTASLANIFKSYRDAAHASLGVNAVVIDLGATALAESRWRAVGSTERAADFEAAVEHLIVDLESSELATSGELTQDYRNAFRAAVQQLEIRNASMNSLTAAEQAARQAMAEVIAVARAAGDTETALYATTIDQDILLTRIDADRFLGVTDSSAADRVRQDVEETRAAFAELTAHTIDPQLLARIRTAQQNYTRFEQSFGAAADAVEARNGYLDRIDAIGEEIADDAATRRAETVDRQDTLGPQSERDASRAEWTIFIVSALGTAAAIAMGFYFAARISAAEQQARQDRRDATGQVADMFEQSVGAVIEALAAASSALQGNARELTGVVEATGARSSSVAAAAEQASAGVGSIAAATEELTASILEVANQVSASADAARSSSKHADESSRNLDRLTDAINGVDTIVQSISGVAEQTNLLALNATIEAARAGEAGKGFAVVASEVKKLAERTQALTEQIGNHLQKIGGTANDAIASTREIISRIAEIDQTSNALASAVEEQTAATSEISAAAQQAAAGARSVSDDIDAVQTSAAESASVAETVGTAASTLKQHSDKLQAEVSQFLNTVRAA